jgi:predicted nucleic acid-binding protein
VRVAVIDSSVLINLTHLNLVSELSLFFDRVYVPRAVQQEVNRKRRFRYRLNKMYESSVLSRCLVVDEWNVKLLQPGLQVGEAEAIIQAQEMGAAYFIGDERRAREAAEKMRRRAVGTLRILARLDLHGRAPNYKAMVEKLRRDLSFRASDELVREAADRASEPI